MGRVNRVNTTQSTGNSQPAPFNGQQSTGTVKTYLANEILVEILGRGCTCQCCVHEAYDLTLFDRYGEWSP